MSTIKDGGPAFPWNRTRHPQEAINSITNGGGMSLRDYFAAKAIPSIISECKGDTRRPTERPTDYFARIAYEVADAMIAAREDKP